MKCDICGSDKTYVKDYKNVFKKNNIEVSFISLRRFCSNCNQLVYDKELDDKTLKEAFRRYNKKIGIDPSSIITLRKQYNLSLEDFSKIIGCAKKTLISYEQGTSIPNDIYIVILKTLMDNPDFIKNMIDSNLFRYSDKEYEKINKKLKLDNNKQELDSYNGYTTFSIEKVKEMISILASDSVLKTKMLKEMFYCDFIYYKNTGASITGLQYAKLNYGPVPNNYEKILEYLEQENVIKENIEYNNNYESHAIISKNNKIKLLNEDEINVINKVKKYFKNYSSKKIVDYSHKEKAFIETDYYKNISYDYSFDIDDI